MIAFLSVISFSFFFLIKNLASGGWVEIDGALKSFEIPKYLHTSVSIICG